MASVNKVILIGNLGHAPEVRYTPGGQAIANFNVATNEKWKGKDGQDQTKTEWHKIVVWGTSAENCGKYLSKGSPVYLEGRLQTREWEDKKTGDKSYTTEIVASHVQFLGSPNKGHEQSHGVETRYQENGDQQQTLLPTNDDSPF